jgi:hypothetical protein
MNRTPRQRKCPVCQEEFTPRRIPGTLKITKCCLNPGCVMDYAQGVKAKDFNRETKAMKDKFLDNDSSHWKKKAQKAFNEFIRLRDADLPCVSCDKPHDWHGQFHAGHYKTTGARPDLRFNEDNCHKQCSVCNNHLSGNLADYRLELENRIGPDRLLALEVVLKAKRMSVDDYKEIHQKYTAKIKELKISSK